MRYSNVESLGANLETERWCVPRRIRRDGCKVCLGTDDVILDVVLKLSVGEEAESEESDDSLLSDVDLVETGTGYACWRS